MTYYKQGHVSCPSDTRPLKNIIKTPSLAEVRYEKDSCQILWVQFRILNIVVCFNCSESQQNKLSHIRKKLTPGQKMGFPAHSIAS